MIATSQAAATRPATRPSGPAASGPASSLRRVATWLKPQSISLRADLRNRRHAIEVAAAELARMRGLDPAPVFRALWRREQIGSTALGSGVAIPHARVGGIDHPVTLFMRLTPAIDFDAPDYKPVGCILTILVPTGGDTDDHLQMLALISQMFGDRHFRHSLACASTPPEVQSAFAECIERVA